MDAQKTIQSVIAAQQDLDALTYALRASGGYEAWATAQYAAGLDAASRILGRTAKTDWDMKLAKRQAQEQKKAAAEARKALGNIRQQRLALGVAA